MYLWWHGDFYSSGHYLELEENKRIKFRWYSSVDPAPTDVTVTFEEQAGGVRVCLDHEIPDKGRYWKKAVDSFRKDWVDSLENLKSVLETGIDLRFANRPMLGIAPGDLTEDQIKALNLPIRDGIRLDGVVDGMGAQRCGLQTNDVIIEMAGRPIHNDANSLPTALAGKKAGDQVEVIFYRGPEKKTVTMELSQRPMPEVPSDPAELAKQARVLYEPALEEVEKCFEGVSDARAMRRPDANEWSALEIVAHLIHGERNNQFFLTGLIDGNEFVSDGFGSNVTAQVEATVKAFPSIALMLEELRRAVEETLAYVSFIPADFAANKGSYYRFGSGLLQPNFHITGHVQQIKDALAGAK
jgi:hypothetical protein